MSTEMESRLARLDGAYEQIDRRLTDLRQDVSSLRQELLGMRQEIGQRFASIDEKFTWMMGLIIGTWITTILTILFHH